MRLRSGHLHLRTTHSKEVDGGTELSVSLDVLPENKSIFEEMWPEALKLLKELSEK